MFNVDNRQDIPRDVVLQECLCQIVGRSEITLENYRRIKTITDTEIEVLCKKYKIHIIGAGLNIEYYNNESMVIGGCISEISFLQN